MNLKKGVVALAVTGALASPFAANAAASLKTFGGEGEAQQFGPQATTPVAAGVLNYGMNSVHGPVDGLYLAGTSNHLTIDKIYVADDGDTKKENLVVDFDADTTAATNGDFPGSSRTDVSVAYTADVTIPNEGTFTIDFSGAAGGLDPATAPNLVFVAQIGGVNGSVDSGVNPTIGQFVEVGSVIDYTLDAARNVVTQIVVQIDTNRPDLEGLHFVLADNAHADSSEVGYEAGVDFSANAFQQADALPADIQLYLTSPVEATGVYNPLSISAEEGAAVGSFINATVSKVTNTGGIELNALKTSTISVVEIVDGFALNVVD
jgi:hypothetical protein